MVIKVKAKIYDQNGNFVETDNAILDTGSGLSWVYEGTVKDLGLIYTGKERESITAKGEKVKGKIALASVEITLKMEEKAYGPFDVLLGVASHRFAETEEMRRKGIKGVELILGNDYLEEAGLYVTGKEELIHRGASLLI